MVRLKTAQQRLAWLADHLAEQPGSGIVYCLTVAATQEIADYLRSRGHEVAAYSGQTETTERQALEQALIDGRVKALIATSALGMGFDATLGFVVNMGAPQSPVAYYQQVGRAGRGTDEAVVVLLPALEDRDIWAYFASLAFPRESLVRETLQVLAEQSGPVGSAAIEARVELNRSRLETMLKVLDVDGAVRRVQGGWVATGQPWSYDEDRYARVTEAREREQQAMLDYLATTDCRMKFLRDQLDDPDAVACGRCDNCGGLSLSVDVSEAAVEQAGETTVPAGRPREPTQDVALGPVDSRDRPARQDRRRCRRGPRRGPADRPRLRRPAARAVPPGCRGRTCAGRARPRDGRPAPGVAPRGRRDRAVSSRRPDPR